MGLGHTRLAGTGAPCQKWRWRLRHVLSASDPALVVHSAPSLPGLHLPSLFLHTLECLVSKSFLHATPKCLEHTVLVASDHVSMEVLFVTVTMCHQNMSYS